MCEDFGCCCYSVFRVLLAFLYIEKLISTFHLKFKFLGHLVSNFITWALNFFSHWEDKNEYMSLTFSVPRYVWVTFGIEEEVNLLLFRSKYHDLHLMFICPGLLLDQDVDYVFGTLFCSCILHLLFCSHILSSTLF